MHIAADVFGSIFIVPGMIVTLVVWFKYANSSERRIDKSVGDTCGTTQHEKNMKRQIAVGIACLIVGLGLLGWGIITAPPAKPLTGESGIAKVQAELNNGVLCADQYYGEDPKVVADAKEAATKAAPYLTAAQTDLNSGQLQAATLQIQAGKTIADGLQSNTCG